MAQKLKKAIMYSYAADRVVDELRAKGHNKNYVTILGIGERSVGKTGTAEEAAKEIARMLGLKFVHSPDPADDEFGFTVADLSGDTAESLGGLYDTKDGDTIVYPHKWFPRRGSGLMVVDEFNRITPTAAPILQQLADKHKFGPHNVPPGWTVLFLGNPPQSDTGETYMVNDGFDKSFFSRFSILPVTVTKASWIQYALDHGINNHVLNYVAVSDQVIQDGNPIDVAAMFPIEPSPRSLETAANLIDGSKRAHDLFGLPLFGTDEGEDMLAHMLSGCLGAADAVALIRSMSISERPLEANEVLDSYEVPMSDGETPREKTRRWSDLMDNTKHVLAHISMERALKAIADMDYSNGSQKAHFEAVQVDNIDKFLSDLREEEVLMFTTKMKTEIGARGIKILKVLQKYNKEILVGLDEAIEESKRQEVAA